MTIGPKIDYVLNTFREIYNIPAEITIGYGSDDCQLNVANCAGNFFDHFQPYAADTTVWREYQGRRIPVLFADPGNRTLINIRNGQAFIEDDLLASAFFFLSGWQEQVFMSKNRVLRYPYRESLQARVGIIAMPVVNYYFQIFCDALRQVSGREFSPEKWGTYPYAMCLTHDIDNIRSGWAQDAYHELRRGRLHSAAAIGLRRLSKDAHWLNLKEIAELEAGYGATASYYFIPRRGRYFALADDMPVEAAERPLSRADFFSPNRQGDFRVKRDLADYRMEEAGIVESIAALRSMGCEAGLHGSFGAHLDPEILNEDLDGFSHPVAGGRYHYLYFDMNRTPELLESSRLKYDSTLGFAEEPGFRNGIAFPFHLYNFREDKPYTTLEIPLMVMDTTFRVYKKTALQDILPRINMIRAEAARFGGCLTVLWHNAYFSPYKFAGWSGIYEQLLKRGEEDAALMTSAEKICEFF